MRYKLRPLTCQYHDFCFPSTPAVFHFLYSVVHCGLLRNLSFILFLNIHIPSTELQFLLQAVRFPDHPIILLIMAPIARLAGFLAILTLVPGGFSSPLQKFDQTLQSRGLLRRLSPQPSYCVCNENGCEDSPGCCGNGTCPPRAAPLEVQSKDFDGCSDDQKKAIQGAMDDLSSLATKASEIVEKDGSKTSNKGCGMPNQLLQKTS